MKKFLLSFVAAMICALGANAEVWKKVTCAPADWSGKYLIACDNGEDWAVLDGSRSGDPNSGNLQSTMNYKPYGLNAEGNIETTDCNYYVTIAATTGGYTICSASGWYIGNNADSNALGTTANADLAFVSTISLDATQGVIIKAVEGGSVLRYNHASGQDRFRYFKASTYTNMQKIALYRLDEAQTPVEPEAKGYTAIQSASELTAGGVCTIMNIYGWGPSTLYNTSTYMWYYNEAMDHAQNAGSPIFNYDGDVNGSGLPTEFEFIPAGDGQFYLKDLNQDKYVNGTSALSFSNEPSTLWSIVDATSEEERGFYLTYAYGTSTRYLDYTRGWSAGGPLIGSADSHGRPMRLFKKAGATPDQPEAGAWTGNIIPSITSVTSLDQLEGITLTFEGAKKVEVADSDEAYFFVQNELGDLVYAAWGPAYGSTCDIQGNTVTLRGFYTSEDTSAVPAGEENIYFEDFGAFVVDGEWDYFNTLAIKYEAPVAQPFELTFTNNNVTCENGKKVEANEAGVGADFYLVNEGLTAVGKTATLYKDGNAMSFVMTLVDATAISFLGGSSLITEPGTYILEVPEGTYVDAAGNPSVAYYGTWVLIEKEDNSYALNFDKNLKEKEDNRHVTAIALNDDKFEMGKFHTVYFDGTKKNFIVETGTELKPSITWDGAWMHGLVYVDLNNDGQFDSDTELVSHTPLTGNVNLATSFSTFTAPLVPGEYRIRFKTDWVGGDKRGYDPAGRIGDDGTMAGTNSIWANRGRIIDATLVVKEVPHIWTGKVKFPEVASIDDLLDLNFEFDNAASVEASGFDVLGVVFNGLEPYAIALGNGTFDVFGNVAFDVRKANVKFQKIADLTASSQTAAKAYLKKIGAFEPQADKATVVFAGKSFVVDGNLVSDIISHEFTITGGTVTGIETITTDSAAQIFDLQGRRVSAAQKGIFLVNGKKVVK